jgi:hypothetical protein
MAKTPCTCGLYQEDHLRQPGCEWKRPPPRVRKTWVYILEEDIPYEGSIFYGCFTSWKKAEAEKNKLYAKHITDTYKFTLSIRKEELQ